MVDSSASWRIPHGQSQRNCELQCISHGLMHITYSETCVNVSDGNACMGQLLKNWQHSLISREVSGIAVASYSLLNSNLCAFYTLEEHCSMILGIVHTATTMFPFFNNWQNCDTSRNRWLGYWCIVYTCCTTGSYVQWNVLNNKQLMQMQWAKYRKTWECRSTVKVTWRSHNKSHVKGFIKIHGEFMN